MIAYPAVPPEAGTASGARVLRDERRRVGMSQGELADASGLAVRTIRGLENGAVSAPRRHTLDRLVAALSLTYPLRDRFFDAWGFTSDPRLVRPDQMLAQTDEQSALRTAIRDRMDDVSTVFAKNSVVLDECRHVVREVSEKVVVANHSGVASVPNVCVFDSEEARNGVGIRGVEGCRVAGRPLYLDRMTGVVELEFPRALAEGESHQFSIEREYAYPDHRAAPTGECESEEDPWAGRSTFSGVHRGARLVVVNVVFSPAAAPARCVHLRQLQLGAPYEELGEVELGADATAQVIVVDPVAGWHGLGWEW